MPLKSAIDFKELRLSLWFANLDVHWRYMCSSSTCLPRRMHSRGGICDAVEASMMKSIQQVDSEAH